MWPEREPQTHLPPSLAPGGKGVELCQTWRQNIIAHRGGEQLGFIRPGGFLGGEVLAGSGGRALCLSHRPTPLRLGP